MTLQAAAGLRVLDHPVIRQFLTFASVGLVATLAHYGVLIALVEGLRAPVVAATSCGFLAGASVSYALNQRLTFKARPALMAGFAKFALVGLVGAGFNALIVGGLTRLGLHYLLAQMAATGLVLFWNFYASRRFVFRPA
mgnify:CR=1 FL=1